MTATAGSREPSRFALGSAVVGLLCLSSVLYANRVVEPEIALLGLGIIWISCLPGLAYLRSDRQRPVPFPGLVGLYYAVFFGFPIFLIPLAWPSPLDINIYYRVPLGSIDPGILVILLGSIAVLFLFYWTFFYKIFDNWPKFVFTAQTSQRALADLLWILTVSHFLYLFLPELARIPSLGEFLRPAGYVGMGGLYLLWRRGALTRWEGYTLLLVSLPLEVFARIHSLLLTDLLLLLLFTGLVLWRERQTKIIAVCIALGLFVIASYGAAQSVRYHPYIKGEKLSAWATAIVHNLIRGERHWEIDQVGNFVAESARGSEPTGRFAALTMRASQTWIFQIVDHKTPEIVPYWLGETYRPLLTSFIPRALYPGKPEERTGGAFARRYGLVSAQDSETSVNIPWITELLANFGRWGVIAGMGLIGVLLAGLDRLFNRPDHSDLDFILGLTLIFPLVYPESNFSVMMGTKILLFVSMVIYFRLGSFVLSRTAILGR